MTVMIKPRRKSLPRPTTAAPHQWLDTSAIPLGWGDTTAGSDNLAARIRNTTFVATGGADFFAVPIDAAGGASQFPFLFANPSSEQPSLKPISQSSGRPTKYRKYTLTELVSQLAPSSKHPETDWGKPAGKEV